jgi:asparagine synthase (glutamine-hydrolysing)
MYSLLDRQDRASMGAGIETRLPFLDKELIEWAINLDKKELFDSRENKKILKELSASIYGKEFTYRRKMGFPLPMKDWLDDEEGFQPYLKKIFDDDFLLKRFVDMDFVKSYLGSKSFDNKNLNYGDSERVWIKWFLMVLRTTQDTMKIKGIK